MSRYFPVRSEPWIDCSTCGFTIPRSEAVRHYRTRKLVDAKCADAPGAGDYRERLRMRGEAGDNSLQPVSDQGADGVSSGFGTQPFGETPFGDPTT